MTYVHEFDDGDEMGYYEIEVEAYMDGPEVDTDLVEIRFISHYAAHNDEVLTYDEFLNQVGRPAATRAMQEAESRAVEKYIDESGDAYDEHMDEVRRGR